MYGLIVGIALLVRLMGLAVYGVEDQTGDAVDFDRIGVNLRFAGARPTSGRS